MPEADTAYIRDAVSYAATFMSSVHVEVFPMQAEYTQLAEAGCTGVRCIKRPTSLRSMPHRWGINAILRPD